MKLREYNLEDTIFAPITSIIGGSICVFRISGLRAKDIFLSTQIKFPSSLRTYFAKLKLKGETLDHVLITYFKAPKSFTGEDCVEISLHGSQYIIDSFTNLAIAIGFRLANPGEFLYRAMLNNKIDILQAENINNLILSKTQVQHNLAIRGIEAKIEKEYQIWHNELKEIAVFIEANIDFSDQEISLDTYGLFHKKLQNLRDKIKNILDKGKLSSQIFSGFNIAIVGAPNVGKSSLLNALTRKNSAIISNIPGTTRDIIEVKMDLLGFPINLFDTAGIRENPQDEIEKEGIKKGIKAIKSADMRLFVMDHADNSIANFLGQKNDLIVINKIDIQKIDKMCLLNNLDLEIIEISAKKNINIDKLINKIGEKIVNYAGDVKDKVLLSQRHEKLLNLCFKELENLDLNDNIELTAESIRVAISYLDEIFGPTSADDILEGVFSKFCIGK